VRENGVALAGARVAFVRGAGPPGSPDAAGRPSRGVQTGDDGSYRLEDLEPGEHRLRITHRLRSMPATVPVFLRAGDNAFDVELDVAVVRGLVRDSDGRPVADASVRAASGRGGAAPPSGGWEMALPGMETPGNRPGTRTGADGRFELRGVQAGVPLQVHVRATGFSPASSPAFAVGPAEVRDGIDLQLAAAGAVRVRTAAEVPFATVVATLQGEGAAARQPVVQMLRGGEATLDGLRPGRWQIELRGLGGDQPAEPQFVEVVAGRTVEVTF
jgi:hypothetical protein